jgi:hypothetical protein
MPKIVQISADDITYNTLPGNTGELTRDGAVIDDTIWGQTFRSGFTGLIGWGVSANAVYKGYPGYVTKLLKPGTSTAMTGEATTLTETLTYQITNAAKRVLDRATVPTVLDNAVAVSDANIQWIDYLFGRVKFIAGYVPTGPITITGNYLPTQNLGKSLSHTLTMTAGAVRTTDYPTAQANNGHNTFSPGLRQVSLETGMVYNSADAWAATHAARGELILEINPDGVSKSIARGFFRLMSQRQSGNNAELEEEGLNFQLNVPLLDVKAVQSPFSWTHAADTPLPLAVRKCLDAYLNETLVWVKYLPNGIAGFKGQAVVTNTSLTGGLESANSFTIALQGTGQPVAVP